MTVIQEQPSIMLGPDPGSLTDYTCAIRSFIVNQARTTVAKSPSFGSPELEQKAAASTSSVTIDFLSEYVTTSGLWSELLTAQGTVTAELYFEWIAADDTVGAGNPKLTGYIKVTDLDTGAPIGQARRQVKTFPARAISAPIVA